MNLRKILPVSFFLFLYITSFSQANYKDGDFRSPIDYRIVLSGNFGELRPNHFHSGIDLKTDNKIGKRIYAIADGYVSRINVSPYGYGLALYVDHPNGFTSVYAHLYMFNDKINKFIKEEQYKYEKYQQTIYPNKDDFPVKKGDFIAISGNSGHSFGPHLHFEVRDTKTEKPLNTLKYGFPVTDNVSPRFFHIVKYPLSEKNRFIDETEKMIFPVKVSNGVYNLSTNQVVKVGRKTAFGYRVHDFMNFSPDRVDLYQLKVFLDDTLIYFHQIDEFDWDESRNINSHADFDLKNTTNKWTQKCYVEPNNQLKIYKTLINRGIVELNDFEIHNIKVLATDIHNNSSTLVFKIQRDKLIKSPEEITADRIIMPFNLNNTLNKDGLTVFFPAGAFYDTIFFKYTTKPKLSIAYSPIYSLHTEKVPIQKYCNISIQSQNLPKDLFLKAVIVKINKSGNFSAFQTKVDSLGVAYAKTREFGDYTILVDKTPPLIKALNIQDNKNISAQQTIEFKVSDNLSGIAKYNAYIDDKWVLLEYYSMKKKLIYTIDSLRLEKGKHKLELAVEDAVGNISMYSVNFVY